MSKVVSREFRKYLYGVAIAFVPLAVYLGWIEPEASVVAIPLIVAILNLTPKEEGFPSDQSEDFSGRHTDM